MDSKTKIEALEDAYCALCECVCNYRAKADDCRKSGYVKAAADWENMALGAKNSSQIIVDMMREVRA
ncbi:hypothetical protein [Sansalvadorimonas verongulae]|uniref:hypothetical protein n=1 Tax=Sansalvadorimonas verongulae TaxID=2172824 RepID=UPI0012BCDDD0|nr:hypothetical protein [Sansalvadorimonas verongulae]MTI12255.1 hypothetical protein [Sansalvadorimonas verongulae]